MTEAMLAYYGLAIANILLPIVGAMTTGFPQNRRVWQAIPPLWSLQLFSYFQDAGYTSLSGIPATCCIGGLVLSTCTCLTLPDRRWHRPAVLSGVMLMALATFSLSPEPARHNSFMMSYLFAILFFLSRPISLGLTLFALSGMIHQLFGTQEPSIRKSCYNATFLAAIVFLGGEIVGCYWGFLGWGTTWRWSGNFLFSAMTFVLYMISLHVPRNLFQSARTSLAAFTLPLVVITLSALLSKMGS